MRSSLSSSSRLVSVRVCARKPGKMLSECSRTPPGSASGGTLETLPRDHPRTPRKESEKDPFCQVVNNHRALGDSLEKSRVGSFLDHSPISLTLPLSSPKGDGFATTPARGRKLPVRASVICVFNFCSVSLVRRNQPVRAREPSILKGEKTVLGSDTRLPQVLFRASTRVGTFVRPQARPGMLAKTNARSGSET